MKVGIFWIVDGEVVGNAVNLENATSYDFSIQHGDHFRYWNELNPSNTKEEKLKITAWDTYPRGQVIFLKGVLGYDDSGPIYDTKSNGVEIHFDPCLVENNIPQVISFFELANISVKTNKERFGYYCAACCPEPSAAYISIKESNTPLALAYRWAKRIEHADIQQAFLLDIAQQYNAEDPHLSEMILDELVLIAELLPRSNQHNIYTIVSKLPAILEKYHELGKTEKAQQTLMLALHYYRQLPKSPLHLLSLARIARSANMLGARHLYEEFEKEAKPYASPSWNKGRSYLRRFGYFTVIAEHLLDIYLSVGHFGKAKKISKRVLKRFRAPCLVQMSLYQKPPYRYRSWLLSDAYNIIKHMDSTVCPCVTQLAEHGLFQEATRFLQFITYPPSQLSSRVVIAKNMALMGEVEKARQMTESLLADWHSLILADEEKYGTGFSLYDRGLLPLVEPFVKQGLNLEASAIVQHANDFIESCPDLLSRLDSATLSRLPHLLAQCGDIAAAEAIIDNYLWVNLDFITKAIIDYHLGIELEFITRNIRNSFCRLMSSLALCIGQNRLSWDNQRRDRSLALLEKFPEHLWPL